MSTAVTPKFAIGDVVFIADATQEGKEAVKCPDCLGECVWHVRNAAGYECGVECPRCKGRGELAQRCYTATVREFRIDGIRTDTTARDPNRRVEYAERTGQASHRIAIEADCHATREEAEAAAAVKVTEGNARLEELEPHRERFRHLSTYQLRDATIQELEQKERDARWAFERLRDRVCELDTHPLAGSPFELRSCSITEEQRDTIQECIMSYDDGNAEYLREWREQE